MDQEGYSVQACDLTFVSLDTAALSAMVEGSALLGLSPADYRQFRSTFLDALVEDQVDDCDARVQGTAAHFFSRNPKKKFPRSLHELAEEASLLDADFSQAQRRWSDRRAEGELPHRHYWDSRARLYARKGAESDYDMQISSDTVFGRLAALDLREPSQGYWSQLGFWRHPAFLAEFRAITNWALIWEERTGRRVRFAGFPAAGPSGSSALSSKDWVL